jgi:hypothetical protein
MDPATQQQLKERFEKLPKSLQDAITSADIEQHLRGLSDKQKLHLDQWNKLENEVMLTLLGLERAEDLTDNIEKHVGVTRDIAITLSGDIMQTVFNPVRAELERSLEHPDAQAKSVSGIESVGAEALLQEAAAADTTAIPIKTPEAPAVAPIVPVPAAPEEKAVRAPAPETYKPGETSAARKSVVNDPYRESPL